MAEKKHIEAALSACAERGVPEPVVPWPEIRDRALVGRRPERRGRFVPRTRVGWVFAAALIMLFSMGAYAAGGLLFASFQYEVRGGDAMELGHKLDLSQTDNGMRVSLEWAYADQHSVVVGYNIREMQDDRRVFGHPTRLEPSFDQETVLTDGGGARLQIAEGGGWSGSDEDVPVVAVFEAERGLQPGQQERFSLKVPVGARVMASQETTNPDASAAAGEDIPYQVQTGDPFVFDFEIPVRKAPTVEVNQDVEANGVTLTLDRVVDSPGRPEAVFCYESPGTGYDWELRGERGAFFGGGPMIGDRHACTSVLLDQSFDGRSMVTVERLDGVPDCPPGSKDGCTIPRGRIKAVDGPWTFEFEVPED